MTKATSPPASEAAWIDVAAPYDHPSSPTLERGRSVLAVSHSMTRSRSSRSWTPKLRSARSLSPWPRASYSRRSQPRCQKIGVAARISALLPPKPWSITTAQPASRGLSKYHAARVTPSPRIVDILRIGQRVLAEVHRAERGELLRDQLVREEPRDDAVPDHGDEHGPNEDSERTAHHGTTVSPVSAARRRATRSASGGCV